MHCIDDKPNGIVLNHNSDWSGEVRIAWYITSERRDPGSLQEALCAVPPSLRECWCRGPDLVAGLFTPTNGPPDESSLSEPPINVITRAVALAVETYLRSKMGRALDDLFIQRGKL